MSDGQFTIADMLKAAQTGSPSDFQAAFNSVLLDKAAAAIEAKRSEVAQNYFGTQDQEESQEEDSEIDSDNNNEEDTDENTETTVGTQEA